MESESVATEIQEVEEKGPALYNPKALSLVSSLTSILSWVVLVAFIGEVVAQYLNLHDQLVQNNLQFATLLKEQAGFPAYLLTNFSHPLFTGIALFLVMQGVAIGLNVLMELDLKTGDE